MTKSGAEKKRVRRAGLHNGTRDPNDIPPKVPLFLSLGFRIALLDFFFLF